MISKVFVRTIFIFFHLNVTGTCSVFFSPSSDHADQQRSSFTTTYLTPLRRKVKYYIAFTLWIKTCTRKVPVITHNSLKCIKIISRMLRHKECLSLVQVTQFCEVPDLIRLIWPGYCQKSIASYVNLVILVNLRSLTNRVGLICSKFTPKINITLKTGKIRWGGVWKDLSGCEKSVFLTNLLLSLSHSLGAMHSGLII